MTSVGATSSTANQTQSYADNINESDGAENTNSTATEDSTETSTDASQESDFVSAEDYVPPPTSKEIVDQHKLVVAQQQNDTVSISTRAMRIKQLNEEFFPSGPKSVQITPEFIQRLSEYNLISSTEASRLMPSQQSDVPSASTLAEAFDFIDDYSTSLPDDSPIRDSLNQAKQLIESWPDNDANKLQAVLFELNEHIEQGEHSTEDLAGLENVSDILSIIQNLNNGTATSEEAKKYIAISRS